MRVRLNHDRLRALIAESGLSQNHWAIKLGLSRGHWSDIVNGKHPYPSAKTRELLLDALAVPLEELFTVESGPGPGSGEPGRERMAERYVIDREIGHGGMGTVYLARDLKLGRLVALKAVSAEAVSGIGTKHFLKEVRFVARLEHPHILALYDADVAGDAPYYVMPYIRGGSLRQALDDRGALSLAETARTVQGISAALDHAHARRVLHCDIKPANVLLADGHPLVADFGIARAIHQEALAARPAGEVDRSAGTPAYVSPEQASGVRTLDGRSDVFSLACLTYELLAGVPPYRGGTTLAVITQRFHGDPPDVRDARADLPDPVGTLLQRGMALDPSRRPASAGAFAAALHAASREAARRWFLRSKDRPARTAPPRRPAAPLTSHPHRVGRMLTTLWYDIRYALRGLRRAPIYAAVVLLTLGIGLAANTLVFGLMNPYFFRALPFGEAERLVQLGHVDDEGEWRHRFSLPQYRDYRQATETFSDLAAYYYGTANLSRPDGADRVGASWVTANMFAVLRAPPARGRTFLPEEGTRSGERVAVIGHGFWQRRFGADDGVLGTTVRLDGETYTIVGVMPRDFVFPFGGIDVWMPIREDPAGDDRHTMGSHVVGRYADGVSASAAHAELTSLHANYAAQYPTIDGRLVGISVTPIRQALNFAWDPLRVSFALLAIAGAAALLLVCVNLASLTLARNAARAGEIAVRSALGAWRGRLMGHFVIESVLLALGGSVVALALGGWGARALGSLIPEDLYRIGQATVDARVVAFTLVVAVVAGLIVAAIPSLALFRMDIAGLLRSGGRGTVGTMALRTRRVLVGFEVAMAVTLVSGLALAGQSLRAVNAVDLGFREAGVMTFRMSLPADRYPDAAAMTRFYRDAVRAVRDLPGVQSAAIASYLPQNHETPTRQFVPPADPGRPIEDRPRAVANWVDAGYFATMDIPVHAGREFDVGDDTGDPVVIVSSTLARAYWPGDAAVGRTLRIGTDDVAAYRVVGVVGDVRHEGLLGVERPQLYYPVGPAAMSQRFLVVSTVGDPTRVVRPVRQTIRALDPEVPSSPISMAEIVGQNRLPWRLSTVLLAALGAVGLVLAAIGIYGVIAFAVTRQRTEIGIRLALGSTPEAIRARFLREGLLLSAVGGGAGLALAIIARRLLAGALVGVGGPVPVVLLGVLALFAGVAVAASYLPARRASLLAPHDVLRCE